MASEEVVIVPYRDGPYLVRGPLVLRDQDGREIAAGRRTVALCRCGKSRLRPFCDGSHHLVRFRAPSGPETRGSDRPPEAKGTQTPILRDPPASSSRLAAAAAHDELAAVDGDLARLRRRLERIAQDGLTLGAHAALAEAARSLATATALLHEGLPGVDPEASR
ncbi:MAG TPA: CDGSH iron-sulfur domain-containing protein [Solirubrobacteraceae bacterium]|nr:CDGSH iron-sulfur domain-containing protein [Solirubrobacteraceae bacterium]